MGAGRRRVQNGGVGAASATPAPAAAVGGGGDPPSPLGVCSPVATPGAHNRGHAGTTRGPLQYASRAHLVHCLRIHWRSIRAYWRHERFLTIHETCRRCGSRNVSPFHVSSATDLNSACETCPQGTCTTASLRQPPLVHPNAAVRRLGRGFNLLSSSSRTSRVTHSCRRRHSSPGPSTAAYDDAGVAPRAASSLSRQATCGRRRRPTHSMGASLAAAAVTQPDAPVNEVVLTDESSMPRLSGLARGGSASRRRAHPYGLSPCVFPPVRILDVRPAIEPGQQC